MTAAADRVFLDGEVHSLADPDRTHEAVAVRDGAVVRVGRSYDVRMLAGVDTETVDLDGRPLLPGFVDAHTHLPVVGRYRVHADLSRADSRADAVDLLAERAAEVAEDDDGWVLGYGYDESTWAEGRYLTREDLDAVSRNRPVAAFREDMHVASVNAAALDRLGDALPADDDLVPVEGGEPTGVLFESAVDAVTAAVEPGVEGTRALVEAAVAAANARGVTAVHDMVRDSHAPRVYRDLDLAGELSLRIRINYWSDHLGAVREAGLRTNHGSEFVRVGAIKTFTDGSLGGRTARLSAAYDDAPGETGDWVVDPGRLRELRAAVDDAGLQMAAHAIGDAAVDETLAAYAEGPDPGAARHRIEHAELADDDAIERLAETGVVACVQPNFLKWAGEGGLYDDRIGDRRTATNRYRRMLDAGVNVAFGSDCMPLDPLAGVHWAVNAPAEAQRLTVTEALRAYTSGAAYAGFDEDRMGTVEPGKRADFVVLESSPWDRPGAIRDIDVAMTVVDGDVVHDAR